MKSFICALLVLSGMAATAQEEIAIRPSMGINAGTTFSSLRGNSAAEANDPAFNYLVGVSLEVPLNGSLSFATAVNYERKSVSRTLTLTDPGLGSLPDPNDPAFRHNDVDAKYTMQYISVPLTIRYYIGSQKRFFINGGPYAAFLIDDVLKVEGDKVDDGNGQFYKSADLGLTVGAGTQFRISDKNDIKIEIRNNLGLTDISDVEIINGGTLKTNSVNLIINWSFKL